MLVVHVDIVAIYGSRASEATKKTEGIVLPGMAHSTTSLLHCEGIEPHTFCFLSLIFDYVACATVQWLPLM